MLCDKSTGYYFLKETIREEKKNLLDVEIWQLNLQWKLGSTKLRNLSESSMKEKKTQIVNIGNSIYNQQKFQKKKVKRK